MAKLTLLKSEFITLFESQRSLSQGIPKLTYPISAAESGYWHPTTRLTQLHEYDEGQGAVEEFMMFKNQNVGAIVTNTWRKWLPTEVDKHDKSKVI